MSIPDLTRRRWLAAAAGFCFAGVGAGLAWRTFQRQSIELSQAEDRFWQQKFSQLDGVELLASAFKGKPLMLNFWATWCPPCVEELPLLNAFFNENKSKSWQVLGLAVDQVTPVKRFLGQSPLDFPVALAGFAGMEVSKSLGNLSGGLPFTVVFDASGSVLHRKMGKLKADELQAWSKMKI
ncbi:thiol-disulfide oxidoreductase ResA [Rhodoferax lithotrophicus]|uniref:Thiol-disulfide oxidoreductase ResA n=1 Tax=Rhodoferax lithotrophicus TaxID=2798804 RepID=A0ABN6D852_9BURK|nr:TlpA disulfide reductase family protein [Rhodoferax sp. MIZ03]BCO26108.1 thiol-disulfide oxidoreductase ResA [Rhodoferax sp. MIZ03]